MNYVNISKDNVPQLGSLYYDHSIECLWANSWGPGYYSVVVTFSDDAPFFVAPRGGFFVTAKDGTVRHVDQLGKQFYLFFVFISALARTLVFLSLIRAFPGARMRHRCGLQCIVALNYNYQHCFWTSEARFGWVNSITGQKLSVSVCMCVC